MAIYEEAWIKAFKFGMSLDIVPPEERTLDVCVAAIKKASFPDWEFCYVPEAIRRDQKLWDFAYAEYVCDFAEVPEEFRTPEMCAVAMEAWPLNLRWVPDAVKTP